MKSITYMKRAEKDKNRIIIPQIVIDKFGRDFYLELDLETGKMILTPINLEKKGK